MKHIFSDHNKAFWVASGLMLGLIVVVGVLNLAVTFHITDFNYQSGEQGALLQNQLARIEFNRPLQTEQEFVQLISIEPQVDFRVFPVGDELVVDFNQNLVAATEYKINIDAALLDIYGERLSEQVALIMQTSPQYLYFVKQDDDQSQISRWDPGADVETTIYQTPHPIVTFDIQENQLAVVEQLNSDVNTLQLVDLDNNRTPNLLTDDYNEKVYDIQFVPSAESLIVLKENIQYGDGYSFSDGGRWVHIYDLATQEFRPIELGTLGITDIDQFEVSQDGSSLLIRDGFESRYYLIDVGNSDVNVPLGRYVDDGGLNAAGDNVVFNAYDPVRGSDPYVLTVNYEKQEQMVSKRGRYAIDPQFFSNTDRVIYAQSYRNVAGTRGLFALMIAPQNSEAKLRQIRFPNHSLELPVISVDDQFVASELYTIRSLRDIENTRTIGYQPRPATADIVVYDLSNPGEPRKRITGAISPLWR